MARPETIKRVCKKPPVCIFIPKNIEEPEIVNLSVIEYEVIRLLDYEHKTQEECAMLMDVARTTITETYEKARKKIANCLVNGYALEITGGNYALCNGTNEHCEKECQKKLMKEIKIKIAIPYEEGIVFPHFGHTKMFIIYDVENNEIINKNIIAVNASGHGELAMFLANHQVKVLICDKIGSGAINALHRTGIEIYANVNGMVEEVIIKYLNNELIINDDPICDCHDKLRKE